MSLSLIKDEILKAKRIGLSFHTSPDGDALGSTLALLNALRYIGKDAYIISENEKGTINILIKYINGEKNDKGYNFNAEIYIFIRVK